MRQKALPKKFIERCKAVSAKRPRTVIEHILKYGHITTEELRTKYGYNHPPRAARDVREQGIPLETFRVQASDGRSIGAYRFGSAKRARFSNLAGRTAFAKQLKAKLLERDGPRCAIYMEELKRHSRLTTGFHSRSREMTRKKWKTLVPTCCSPVLQIERNRGPANTASIGWR